MLNEVSPSLFVFQGEMRNCSEELVQNRPLKTYQSIKDRENGVDKKNKLDVTFCILYFSSNSCSTCFGQPCAHHQELTTA